jgi:tetratricopeptide (TPR) repeat protein
MTASQENTGNLEGKRIAFVGKLTGMGRREAAQLLRGRGAAVLERLDPSVQVVVIGEDALPLPEGEDIDVLFDEAARQAVEAGNAEVLTETQLWHRLGLVEFEQGIHRLYTPAMLADLLGVSVAVIRRWRRRGLIVPVREVRRLPYFDFQEVATARRLTELLASGISPRSLEKKLEQLARYVPGVRRPLAQLSVIVEGKQILLRQGEGLVEPGGQMRFDFPPADEEPPAPPPLPSSPEQMAYLAERLEEDGQLPAAAEMYRAAMAAGGPKPDWCFQTAELLYRLGDLAGARERYYMAVELDEDYVEARANLGCLLAELGQRDLAVAAFEGALRYHPDYADVHYHLARTLEDLRQPDAARLHWERFLALSPESPWADEARRRLTATDGG